MKKISKAKQLFDLIMFINTKRKFTARDVADEFKVSVRTAHRYLVEISRMGVPLYTEPGRHGGYRLLENRMLPPIIFNENEALAIFFAFQALKYYKSLPFTIDLQSVSRKLYTSLPADTKAKIERLDCVLSFWNKKRSIPAPFLKEIIAAALENQVLKIDYQSKHQNTQREISPLGAYAYDGFWYMPAFDLSHQEIRVFRLDRILALKQTPKKHPPGIDLESWLAGRTAQDPKDPVPLYVELTREGIRQSQSQPWLEPYLKINGQDHGYLEMEIDRSELEYVSDYFLQLGTAAKVIEPQEVIDTIRRKLQATLLHYS